MFNSKIYLFICVYRVFQCFRLDFSQSRLNLGILVNNWCDCQAWWNTNLNIDRLEEDEGRIVGGEPTNIGEHPYQVSALMNSTVLGEGTSKLSRGRIHHLTHNYVESELKLYQAQLT